MRNDLDVLSHPTPTPRLRPPSTSKLRTKRGQQEQGLHARTHARGEERERKTRVQTDRQTRRRRRRRRRQRRLAASGYDFEVGAARKDKLRTRRTRSAAARNCKADWPKKREQGRRERALKMLCQVQQICCSAKCPKSPTAKDDFQCSPDRNKCGPACLPACRPRFSTASTTTAFPRLPAKTGRTKTVNGGVGLRSRGKKKQK